MSFVYVLIGFVLLLTCATLIILIGDLPGYRGTFIHHLHVLLVNRFYSWLRSHFECIDRKLFRGVLSSDASKANISCMAGWSIPIFYLIVITRCLAYFFMETFPQITALQHLDESSVNWTLRLWLVIIPVIAVNYSTFLLAVLSDAGTIDPTTHPKTLKGQSVLTEFPYDSLIFYPQKCSTCNISKPARSKHCSSCDKCVLMFDHHCVWLNNDVAYYTFRWFFLFLASTCFIFIYGGYLCAHSLELYARLTPNIPKPILDAPMWRKYWWIVKETTFTNEVTGIMFLLCVCLFPLVGYFFGETVWSIYLGVTTNEIGKWNYINDLRRNQLLYQFFPENGAPCRYLILSDRLTNGQAVFLTLGDYLPFESSTGGNLRLVTSWNDMNNMYDKGFWSNLHQKLFPAQLDLYSP